MKTFNSHIYLQIHFFFASAFEAGALNAFSFFFFSPVFFASFDSLLFFAFAAFSLKNTSERILLRTRRA